VCPHLQDIPVRTNNANGICTYKERRSRQRPGGTGCHSRETCLLRRVFDLFERSCRKFSGRGEVDYSLAVAGDVSRADTGESQAG